MTTAKALIVTLLAVLTVASCSSTAYISPVSRPARQESLQVTDEDVKKALEIRPQMMKPLNVAIYKTGFVDHSFVDSLRAMPGIATVFELNPWLVEGEAYQNRRSNKWYGNSATPRSTDFKSLRLLAAQGRADLLIYCGISHELRSKANWLAFTYLAVLPALFVPGVQAQLVTEGDLVFVDVRNGFFYGSYHDITRVRWGHETLLRYKGKAEHELEDQAEVLIPGMLNAMSKILENENLYVAVE